MRATTGLAAVALLLAVGCSKLEDVAPGTVVTCSTNAHCPAGRICHRDRCILPSDLGTPPDLVLVDGKLAVSPPAGRAGTAFTVMVEATKELEAPPRVILSLDSLVELPCTATGARTYACTYTATGAERGGLGGHVTIDVRMVDVAGMDAVKNGVGGFDLDFAPPVLAARSVAPESVPLGGVLQVFFTTDEDLGPSPILVASRALDEPGGDGVHFTLTRQPGTRNYLFTHRVTSADGAGPVDFTVDATDAVGNTATALAVGSIGLDPAPPALSGLAASPARLAAAGTLTVTFDASEAAAPGTLAVTVGGRPLSCGAWAASSPRYTCTRAMTGTELAAGTEAVQSVVVALADAAGNRATASTSVVFDFKAPTLASRSAGPASVPLGGALVVSFTPDEDLGASPVLVASRPLDEAGGTRFTLTRQPGSRSYEFAHVVTASDAAGPVEFTAELTDLVGNPATGLAVGSATLDNVAPVLSSVAASAARIGTAGTLTVTFASTEQAAPGTLAVTVGGRPMTCGAYSATPPSYTCTRAMTGAEIPAGTEAAQSIAVSLADAAGNRASASGSAVVFDFKAPALSGATAGPAAVPLGGTLVVSFTPDEDLGASPVLVASRALDAPGGTRFTLAAQPGTRNYQFTHVVTANDPAGTVTFTAEATDLVGNAATALAVGSLTIDNLVPAISAVAATPSRLGTAGTLTVTLASTEQAAPGTLAVTVGGRPMTCGAYSATPPSYTCTRAMTGAEIATGTEAAQSISVSLADAAGNRASASGSAVVFDFKAPVLAGSSAQPADVALGGVILVSFTPDEDLGTSPVLVASRALDEPGGGTRFPLAPQPGTRNYLFTHLVTTSDTSGPVTFTAELTDVVGNAVTGVAVGTVTLDTVAPLVSALAVSPARVGRSGTVTATFDVDGAAAPGTLVATVGGRTMTCGAYSATPPSYTCTRAMTGAEIAVGTEAVQPVVVNLADVAGNPARASGSTVFDFRPPALAAASVAPANVPLGGTLVVSFTPDEDLGPSPVLVASRTLDAPGGTRFTLTAQPGTRNYQFTHVVTAADPAAQVDFTVEVADGVGNSVTGLAVGSAVIDNVVPVISAVSSSAARIGTTGTLTVTFASTEQAAPGTLAVTVGGRAMACGAWSATPPSYTCTRAMTGTEIAAGTEAAQSIAVTLADVAGNRASASGSAAVFDFKAPALAGATAGPAAVPLGGTLVVSFTPDEDLGASPVLVASRALDAPGATRFTLTAQPGTRNYQFTHVVTANDPLGTVTFTAEAADLVSNAATGLAVGSVTIDNVVPAISAVAATPSRLGSTGTLTVTFSSTEQAAPGTLAATVGGRAMSCGPYSATPPSYTCTRAMTGTEIAAGTEAAQSIAVTLADAAGNRASASGSAVVFDFKAPVLAGSSAEPANVPLGGVLLVSFTPDEDLGANPVLVASRALDEPGATRFPLTAQPGTRNYLFTHIVTTSDTSGPVTFTAELTDVVGNAVAGVPVGSLTIDTLAPLVSAVAVSPARIGRSGTVTTTFDVDGAAAPGTLAVTVGGRAMSCGAYQASSPSYTCTRAMAGNEITLGTEASQPVVVSLADVAGNPARSSGTTVFDFKPPSLAAKSAGPANVPLNGTLLVTFTPDEDLGPDPVLVATWTAPARFAGGVSLTPVRQAGTRNYSFTYPVTTADATGPVTFTANLADPYGNSTAAVAVGTVRIDVDPISVTGLAVSPARIRSAGTLTLAFDASEAASTLAATVGGLAMTCGAYQPSSPRYTCTRAMVGNEIAAGTEAAQSVVATLADAAGNRTTASGSTVFDFQDPVIVGSVALDLTPPPGSLAPAVTAVSAGTRIRLSFTVSEPLAVDPVVVTSTPEALAFTKTSQSGTFYVYEHVLSAAAHAQGTYTVRAQLTDVAGNAAAPLLALPAPGIRVDTGAPASPDVATVDRITYARAPWGTAATAGVPQFTLTGLAGAVEANAAVVAYDGEFVSSAREIGRATATAGGAFGPMTLIAADRREVYVVAVDAAGNASDAKPAAGVQGVRVRDVTWTATLQNKVLGSTVENPHQLEARARWLGALEQGASVEALLATSTVGTLGWKLASTPGWITGMPVATDTRRGRLVVPTPTAVWEWDGEVWSSVVASGGPAAITATVYDARRAEVLVYEGACDGGTTLWAWTGRVWEPRAQGASYTQWGAYGSPAPGPHRKAFLTYDEARGEVILAPGPQFNLGPYTCGDVSGNVDYGTYRWDGSAWHLLPGTNTYSAADGRWLAYDANRKVVARKNVSGLTEWDGSVWTTIDPAGITTGPTAGSYGEAVYDPVLGRIIFQADTDVWSWTGTNWVRSSSTAVTGNLARGWGDSPSDRALAVGTTYVYRWNGSGWSSIAYNGSGPPAPVGVVYSSGRARSEAFDASGSVYRWSPTFSGWVDMTPATHPSGIAAASALDSTGATALAHATDRGAWSWDGALFTSVTPSTTVRPPATAAGMAWISGTGPTLLTASGAVYYWSANQWTSDGTVNPYCTGTPAAAPALPGMYFSCTVPYDPDRQIYRWTAAGGGATVYTAAGLGTIHPIAADGSNRTFVLQSDGLFRLSGSTLSQVSVDDPRGVGHPTAVDASTWDATLGAVVVLAGTKTWFLETEAKSRPGHLFRVAWPSGGGPGGDCFQRGSTCTVRNVGVSWRGLLSSNGTAGSTATLSLWNESQWVQVAQASSTSATVQASASVTVTDAALLGHLAALPASEVDLAITLPNAALAAPLLRTDDVAVTVTYRLP